MGPGDLLGGRFEIERLAASGGMGQVFRARDRLGGEPVAVKVLRGGQAAHFGRFRREARVLESLSQLRPEPQEGTPASIVRYITHGLTPSEEPYLVMEWLEGEDLGSRLGRGRLTVAESLTVALQAATSLGVVHARGLIHRDLKPKNLFLVEGRLDRLKLLDFGIARTDDTTLVTQVGELMGTPRYMAPEQCRSEQTLDARVDVHALGCVLFECLTGRPAFHGQHALAVLMKILFEAPPRLGEFLPQAPAELEALVAQMMAKEPERRPRDGVAVAGALAALTDSLTLTGGPGPAGGRPSLLEEVGRLPVLTRDEQRILSVILIGPPPEVTASASASTLAPAAPGPPLSPLGPLDDAVTREVLGFGGRLERLIDGSMVVTIAGRGMAKDQAALAARCALVLGRCCLGRWITLATDHDESLGRAPGSEAIDRAAGLLVTEGTPLHFAAELAAGLAVGAGDAEAEAPAILLDDVTAGLLDARFDVRESSLGLVLRGLRELPAGMRTLLGRPTACVGRDRDLAVLLQALSGCSEESQARAVLVAAPAGMGKSRLLYEFLGRLGRLGQQGQNVAVWIGRGDALGADSPLSLLAQALRHACDIRDREPLALRQETLRARVALRVARDEQPRIVAFLGELMGIPFPDSEYAPLRAARRDPQLMNEQLRTAWIDFLRAACSDEPVVLVFEDLQWGDATTVRFVTAALRELPEAPWMVLGLGRPEIRERFPELWNGPAMQLLHLPPLARKAGERLVRQVLGDAVSADTMERLVTRSDGNPFYLEELIRATAAGHRQALPETVIAMVQSRLAVLGEEARRALRAASIFGEVFRAGAVAHLLGSDLALAQTDALLQGLVEQEVLAWHHGPGHGHPGDPGESEYAFRHSLLREGAYAMLVEEDRALGHRLAVEWLEAHGESDPLVLAEHLLRAREPERAAYFYQRAAEQALAAGAMEEGAAHAQRVLGLNAPEAQRLEVLGLLCEIHMWRLQWDAAAPWIEEVLRLAAPGSAPWARAMILRLANATWYSRPEELKAAFHLLREIPTTTRALGAVLFTICCGVYYLDHVGEVKMADDLLDRLHTLLEPVTAEEPIAAGWEHCLRSRRIGLLKEDPWEGIREGELGRIRFREAGYQQGMYGCGVFIATNRWLLGALAEAEAELRSLEREDEMQADGAAFRRFALVGVLADRGALEEARREAERMVEFGRRRQLAPAEGRGLWALAEVLRRQGELAAAETAIRAACDRLGSLPPDQVSALATLGAILLAQGRTAEAAAVVGAAMARYNELGVCHFARSAFLHTVHAESLRACGDPVGARAGIAKAHERLLAMAARISDPAYRQGFFALPEHARILGLAREWLGEQ